MVINQGKVIDAVRASISIPGIFTPVKYQNFYLVDGGLVNPVPVDVTKNMGADIIIAISLVKVKSKDPKEELKSIIQQKITEAKSSFKAPGIFHIITQTIDIMESKVIERSLEGADIVIVPFGLKDIHDFDFDKAEELIRGGITSTLIKIPEIKTVIKAKLKQN